MAHKLTFHWDIQDFIDGDLDINEFFDSPRFFTTDSTFKSDWKLRMYPAGFQGTSKSARNLSVILLRLDTGSTFRTKHSISFLNRNGRRIETKYCSELCEPLKFTDSKEEIMNASNKVELTKYTPRFLDGGVLSVLCEIEIYEISEDNAVAVTEKHSQMRGTSWVIQNKQRPTVLNLIYLLRPATEFYVPYGNRTLCLSSRYGGSHLYLKIIDEIQLEINEVPITIVFEKIKSNWNITRSECKTVYCYDATLSFDISVRCMVESTPDASPINVTACVRKMQTYFRNIFSQSDGGDMSIAVDGKVLRVHKNVLSGRCPVFAAMFNQEWRENTTQIITIKEFDYKTILALIEYIYFGGCDEDHGEETIDTVDLLKAAHMYQLDDLKNKCEQLLCECIEKNNVVDYIALAFAYDLSKLKKKAFNFNKINHF